MYKYSRHLFAIDGGRCASRSAKFGVMVFKASMLDWGGRSATFGVTVFKASMLDWGGRCASWSANVSSNSRNVKLPFLTARWYAS